MNRLASQSPRLAIVGGGLSGSVAARLLAEEGAKVTLFESARGLGGRSSTRRVPPEQQATTATTQPNSMLFFDHGLPGIKVPKANARFATLVKDWEDRGFVQQWGGPFQRLDAASGVMSLDPSQTQGAAWYTSVPHANSLAASLAQHPSIEQRIFTRVVSMRLLPSDQWQLGVRPSDGPPHVLTDAGPYDALVITDKQAVSNFSVRQYGEAPLMDREDLPPGTRALAEAMKGVGQVPRFTLMIAFRGGQNGGGLPSPLGRVAVTGSAVVETITDERSKPQRAGDVTCLVVNSTEGYAVDRIGAQLTVKETRQHANLLDLVAEEMAQELLRLVPALRDQELIYRVAHRWGACFPSRPAKLASLVAPGERVAVCGDWVDRGASCPHSEAAVNAVQSAIDAVDQLVAELTGGTGTAGAKSKL